MEIIFNCLVTAIVFIVGSAIGSFLNVVVYRLPAGLSVIHPPSRCPKCLNQLRTYENIPVFGWLWLRGRCNHCRSRISARYPLVEAATGLLFLLIFWRFGVTVQTLGFWALFSWLLALSLIDCDTMTLPNSLTRSGLVLGLVFQVAKGWWPTFSLIDSVHYLVLDGIAGAVVGLWLFDAIGLAGTIGTGAECYGGRRYQIGRLDGSLAGLEILAASGIHRLFSRGFCRWRGDRDRLARSASTDAFRPVSGSRCSNYCSVGGSDLIYLLAVVFPEF